MRTSISIPTSLHRSIKSHLSRTNSAKDDFFIRAVRQYLKVQANDETLEALNKVYGNGQTAPEEEATYKLGLRAFVRQGRWKW